MPATSILSLEGSSISKPTRLTLKDRFINYLQENCLQIFTTKEALRWYGLNKANPQRVDYSNLYTVILHPLFMTKRIKPSVVRGVWEVTSISDSLQDLQIGDLQDQETTLSLEEEEFLEYLKSKGVK